MHVKLYAALKCVKLMKAGLWGGGANEGWGSWSPALHPSPCPSHDLWAPTQDLQLSQTQSVNPRSKGSFLPPYKTARWPAVQNSLTLPTATLKLNSLLKWLLPRSPTFPRTALCPFNWGCIDVPFQLPLGQTCSSAGRFPKLACNHDALASHLLGPPPPQLTRHGRKSCERLRWAGLRTAWPLQSTLPSLPTFHGTRAPCEVL